MIDCRWFDGRQFGEFAGLVGVGGGGGWRWVMGNRYKYFIAPHPKHTQAHVQGLPPPPPLRSSSIIAVSNSKEEAEAFPCQPKRSLRPPRHDTTLGGGGID